MASQARTTELFLACCEMAGEERAAFLEESCGQDDALLAEVEGMLAFEERQPDFLEGKAIDVLRDEQAELPESIGGFRIRAKLGEGGMGAVYEAEQESPRRTVALKVLRPFLLSPTARRRFEHEGEFLGRLQHPGIAQIFEVGRVETENGPLPYFAMELVSGLPLTDYAKASALSVRERVELVARVADAVQHAHQHSVIHRDLKPANILVDASGQPKVLDFGIARASESDVQLTTLQTDVGQILGTLAYMSPEQASGDPGAIDTRSDVYSLGVLLYELLTDQLPYDVSNQLLPEAVRIIREEEARRLSAVRADCRGDLTTIVGTALEKHKDRRYASAAALAADLRCFLRDEPIAARPPSRMYVLRKLVRRHRGTAVAGGLVVASLAIGFVVSTSLFLETRAALSDARWGEYRGNLLAAAAELAQGNHEGGHERLEECPEEYRGWEWHNAKLALDSWLMRLDGHGTPISAVGISRDGSHLATVSESEVKVWDGASGAPLAELDVDGGVTSVDVGPQGRLVAFSRLGDVHLWRPYDASPPLVLNEPGMADVRAVRLGPDGTWLANGSRDGIVRIWDLGTHEVRARLSGHRGLIRCLAVSPDGRSLASGSETDSDLFLWDVATGRASGSIQVGEGVKCVVFSPDGERLATGNNASAIVVWQVESGAERQTIRSSGGIVTSLAFDRDGSRLVSGDWSGVVETWDVASGEFLWSHGGHEPMRETGVAIVAHPDGRRFLTSGYEHSPRVWSFEADGTSAVVADFPDRMLRGPDGRPAQAREVRMTPDGTKIVAEVGGIHVWDAETGEPLAALAGRASALAPDGTRVATIRPGRILDLETGAELARLPVTAGSLAFSPDGLRLAAGDAEEAVLHVLDGSTGRLRRSLPGSAGPPGAVCVGPDGSAFSATDRVIEMWDLEEGFRGSLTGHEGKVFDLAVVPGGRRLVSASDDGLIRVWDTAERRCLRELDGRGTGVRSLDVSPDGKRIVSGAADGRVRVWSLQRGDLLSTLTPAPERPFHSPRAAWVAFSPDGERLLTSSHGMIRIWESDRDTARAWWEGRR